MVILEHAYSNVQILHVVLLIKQTVIVDHFVHSSGRFGGPFFVLGGSAEPSPPPPLATALIFHVTYYYYVKGGRLHPPPPPPPTHTHTQLGT